MPRVSSSKPSPLRSSASYPVVLTVALSLCPSWFASRVLAAKSSAARYSVVPLSPMSYVWYTWTERSTASGMPVLAVSVMQSSAVTVRTNSALPLSFRSNRCSPANVTMTDSGLLSPFASFTLRVQRAWAVYSRTPFSFGSAKASTPWRPSRALNFPFESLSQTWKSRAIVRPASAAPSWSSSRTHVPSMRTWTYSGCPSWFASVAVISRVQEQPSSEVCRATKCWRSGAPRTASTSRGTTPNPRESSESLLRSFRVSFSSRRAGTAVPTGSGFRSDALAGAAVEFAGASEGPVDATSSAGGAGVAAGGDEVDKNTPARLLTLGTSAGGGAAPVGVLKHL